MFDLPNDNVQLAECVDEIKRLQERLAMATSFDVPAAGGGHYRISPCFCQQCYRGKAQWVIHHHTEAAYLLRDCPSISVITEMRSDSTFGPSRGDIYHFETADEAFIALHAVTEKANGC